MAGSDDLAPLLVPHHSADSGPTPALSSEEPARYGQGTILTWDAETFENTVRFRGTTLVNLPVMAGTDALTFRPGDKVGIMFWAPAGGSGVFWILPRIIVPGSGAAEQAIAALKSDLGRTVALAVFGEAIRADSVDDSVSIGDQNGTWIDLPGSIGPTVSDVEISESGRAWVFMTARMSVETHTTDAQIVQAAMSYEISGATSRAPDLARALELEHIGQTVGDDDTNVVFVTMTRAHVATALNPGVHTFQAKYTAFVTGSGERVRFSRRELQVIPF